MRRAVLGSSIAAIAAAIALFWWFSRPEVGPGPGPHAPDPTGPPVAAAPVAADPQPPAPAEADAEPDPSEGMFDASAMAWSNVDLDEVRAALPDNSYWERSAPTTDPELLRRREEERAYWEEQYGKVLSNTASEEEVRAYYAHRQQLSTDAIEFSSYLLDQYGDVLPERDVGMLMLAQKLHLARLEELPRELEDARGRSAEHERQRLEWLEQQKLFGEGGTGSPKGD
jgi:hypothetical protein